MEIETNKHGTNVAIVATILSDEKMRDIGFSDYNPDIWYFVMMLQAARYTSFNVSIPKENPADLSIDVLDEGSLQPYDYQKLLEDRPDCLPALAVKAEVEGWMKFLAESGVLSGHRYGDYI